MNTIMIMSTDTGMDRVIAGAEGADCVVCLGSHNYLFTGGIACHFGRQQLDNPGVIK